VTAVPSPSYAATDEALLAACEITSSSSHGPGGQHRNKTESAVRLRHRPSGEVAQCEAHRERGRNRDDALRRLRIRLAIAERGQSDPAWLEPYRRGRQLAAGANAREFPLIAACCLDALAAAEGRLSEAAAALALSSTQLAKLLVADKEVHQAANRLREERGLGAIRG
jgi:protein subunit release factor B